MHKGLESNYNVVNIGNFVLAVGSLAELLLYPVLEVEDTKLPKRTFDCGWDASEGGGIKVVLVFAEPGLVLPALKKYSHCDGHDRR